MKTTFPNSIAGYFKTTCAAKLLPVLLLLMLPSAAEAQYNYITNADGTLTITKYTGPGGAVIIPALIDTLSVSSIGSNAFRQITNVSSVTIPGGVTNIGAFAFSSCRSLTAVSIPNTVISIRDFAFALCTNLAEGGDDPQRRHHPRREFVL